MDDTARQLHDLRLERAALQFLLGNACETLLFYADSSNYNFADDGMEDAAMDTLTFIMSADADPASIA